MDIEKVKKSGLNILFDKINKKEYLYYNSPVPIVQNMGTTLLEFLNSNFNSNEYLLQAQQNFIYTVDFSFNLYNIDNIADLSIFERYYTSRISNNQNKIEPYAKNLSVNFSMDPNFSYESRIDTVKEKDIIEIIKNYDDVNIVPFTNAYSSNDITAICYISFLEIINVKDIFIKKCQNCGKYFIPINRNDEIYCNNIFENNRTCKEIGSMNVWKKKLETDDTTKLYRTIYHMKFNRVKRNPTNKDYSSDFEWWKNNVKEWKDNIKKGKKTEDEFKTWLLKTRDKR